MKASLAFPLLLICFAIEAQDLIYPLFGNPIPATEITIKKNRIFYHEYDDPTGPKVFKMASNLEKIVYADGRVHLFSEGRKNPGYAFDVPSPEQPADSLPEKKHFRNQMVELAYTLIPESMTHGADLHIDFLSIPPKSDAIWRIPVGFGGGYARQNYSDEEFTGYLAEVELQRFYAHATLGFRLNHRHGGLTLRAGYNWMMANYRYDVQIEDTELLVDSDFDEQRIHHRVQMEAVIFKSFTKRKSGVGIFGGVRYLLTPKEDGNRLFMVRAGLGF